MPFPFKSGDRILFQGASTVESGRFQDAENLGYGFAAMVKGLIAAAAPEMPIEVLNRGISGNRTVELLARWKEDCLDLHPTHLSIHVGLNDLLRKFEGPYDEIVEKPEFEANYRLLLDQARAAGIRHLILIEPTLTDLDLSHPSHAAADEFCDIVLRIARDCNAVYVPARKRLLAAIRTGPSVAFWAPDGRHPSPSGHALIAATWMESVSAALG